MNLVAICSDLSLTSCTSSGDDWRILAEVETSLPGDADEPSNAVITLLAVAWIDNPHDYPAVHSLLFLEVTNDYSLYLVTLFAPRQRVYDLLGA